MLILYKEWLCSPSDTAESWGQTQASPTRIYDEPSSTKDSLLWQYISFPLSVSFLQYSTHILDTDAV